MGYYITSAAFGSAGVKTISPGFQPTGYRLSVCQEFNQAEGFEHRSIGGASQSSAYAFCQATFQDTSGGKSASYEGAQGRVISHMERVSSVITDVLVATHDSFTATAIKFNITTPNAGFNIIIEIW